MNSSFCAVALNNPLGLALAEGKNDASVTWSNPTEIGQSSQHVEGKCNICD